MITFTRALNPFAITSCRLRYYWSSANAVISYVLVMPGRHRGGGVTCDHYPRCIESHCTGPPAPVPSGHATSGTSPSPAPTLWTWELSDPIPLQVTSGSHHWRPVHLRISHVILWLLKQVRSAQAGGTHTHGPHLNTSLNWLSFVYLPDIPTLANYLKSFRCWWTWIRWRNNSTILWTI